MRWGTLLKLEKERVGPSPVVVWASVCASLAYAATSTIADTEGGECIKDHRRKNWLAFLLYLVTLALRNRCFFLSLPLACTGIRESLKETRGYRYRILPSIISFGHDTLLIFLGHF
jgi:hypothetical protein